MAAAAAASGAEPKDEEPLLSIAANKVLVGQDYGLPPQSFVAFEMKAGRRVSHLVMEINENAKFAVLEDEGEVLCISCSNSNIGSPWNDDEAGRAWELLMKSFDAGHEVVASGLVLDTRNMDPHVQRAIAFIGEVNLSRRGRVLPVRRLVVQRSAARAILPWAEELDAEDEF